MPLGLGIVQSWMIGMRHAPWLGMLCTSTAPSARKAPKPSSVAGIAVLLSANVKVGNVSATYMPIEATCDASCPFYSADGAPSAGCYAREGKVAMTERRIADTYRGLSADTLATIEAAAIVDAAPMVPAGRPLRLHVSGDARTPFAAHELSRACESWPGPVWTYTHAWRTVPRTAWGGVSVLASVEGLADAKAALQAGYAPAIVVDEHPADGRARVVDGVRVIPCPSQTRDVTCDACKLCWNADRLHALGAAIAFAAHGTGAKKAKRHLTVI